MTTSDARRCACGHFVHDPAPFGCVVCSCAEFHAPTPATAPVTCPVCTVPETLPGNAALLLALQDLIPMARAGLPHMPKSERELWEARLSLAVDVARRAEPE